MFSFDVETILTSMNDPPYELNDGLKLSVTSELLQLYAAAKGKESNNITHGG